MCHGRSCHRVRSRPALVSFAIAQTVAVRRRRADIKAIRWIREPSHHALQPRRTRAHVRAPVRPIDGGGDPELMNALADTELLELERALASAPPRRAPAAATARATDPIVNPGAATARPTAMPGWTGLSAIPPPRIKRRRLASRTRSSASGKATFPAQIHSGKIVRRFTRAALSEFACAGGFDQKVHR